MIKKILLLLMFLPVYLLAWKMESGRTTLPATTVGSSTWQTVTLQQSYDSVPLIFAMLDEGSGYPGDTPAALRVRNIGLNSFEVVQVEPQPDDGAHASMTIHYIAIEPGNHTLHDGTRFLAGSEVDVLDNWQTVNFSPAFTHSPVMLAMIQSMNNENDTFLPGQASVPWMVAGLRSIGTNSFETFLDKVKTAGTIISNETVGYLAISGSSASSVSGSFDSTNKQCIQYETKLTPNSVNGWGDECYVQGLNTYSDTPNVIASMQTRSGGDGGWVRRCSISSSSVGVTIDEDNTNRTHGVNETVGLAVFSKDFIFDSAKYNNSCIVDPLVDYRMDECYWLGSAYKSVKDGSVNGYDAISYNSAAINTTESRINFSGKFTSNGDRVTTDDVNALGSLDTKLTVSAWLYPTAFTEWSSAVQKSSSESWADGFGLIHNNDGSNNITFYVNDAFNGSGHVSALLDMNVWNHIVGVYDGTNIIIYKNGVEIQSSPYTTIISNSNQAFNIGNDVSDDSYDDVWQGNIDEVKVWNTGLSLNEIQTIYNNESLGKNYNATDREEVICSTSIAANSWEMIGIPAESRTLSVGVQDVFGDDFIGTDYDAGDVNGWILWKREYHADDNLADWIKVDYVNNETIEFGKGYWLGSTVTVAWDVDGLEAVDYNSSYNGTVDCVSNRCVEIDLRSVSSDGTDGTGYKRYNLSGFIGKTPVNWRDCRFIVSDLDGSNVEVLTPEEAETAGYASRTISLWPGGQGSGTGGQVLVTDYTECTDTLPGECKLLPYHGVWIEVFVPTLTKTVKLLIPEE